MMAIHDPAVEAAIALLAAQGYKVTRSRPRVARNAAQDGTLAPLPCAHCGTTEGTMHRTCIGGGKGMRGAGYKQPVRVCDACYRFGPRLRAIPRVPVDPVRYARLYRAFRHAQHRYHATIRHDPYSGAYSGHKRLMAITRALSAEAARTQPNTEGMTA